jgi:protein-S-isoprenylcysteine O-methyltransferase Ste14
VTAGVYAFARHPIYGGVLLLAIGWSVAQASLATLGATALLWLLFEAKSRYEERTLVEAYPAYPAYAAATRRFVPFVY